MRGPLRGSASHKWTPTTTAADASDARYQMALPRRPFGASSRRLGALGCSGFAAPRLVSRRVAWTIAAEATPVLRDTAVVKRPRVGLRTGRGAGLPECFAFEAVPSLRVVDD